MRKVRLHALCGAGVQVGVQQKARNLKQQERQQKDQKENAIIEVRSLMLC